MIPILISIVQGDFGFNWNFTLTDANENPVSLIGATSITFDCQLDSDSAVYFTGAMTTISAADGTCRYTPQATDFQVAGTYKAQIKVAYGSGEIISFSGLTIEVEPKIPVS